MPSIAPSLVQDGQDPDITLLRKPAKGRGALSCWLALPREISADAPPLVAIHGIRRGAKAQAKLFGARAAARGRPVIAPLFSERDWPRYQQVVRNKRADLALLALMMELRLANIWTTRTFELVGYSGGGQFVHRFAMLYPQMVDRLTVVSAGWFTFPDDAAFPYGLAARPGRTDDWGPRLAAGLNRFLRLPIQVCVGARDNIADANTRNTPQIVEQQGPDRMTRAKRWTAALQEAAAARRIRPQVSFNVLPDCGHDFLDCVQHGGLDRLVLPEAEQQAGPVNPMPEQPSHPMSGP